VNDVLQGHCDARFDKVAEALAEEITTGEEVGAAIAIDIDGELVVDIWGGHADAAKTVPWGEDTIVNVFSSTKNITALAGLMLIDRGLVEPSAPVANYWPEFAANGKQDIEFRHLLSHSSGLSGWDVPFTNEDMYDWDKSTAALAAQAPWWEPGTASGYHALTYGHLIGEVLRRVTGKTLKDFVRDEIAGPVGADFQIGASIEDTGRIAEIVPATEPLDLPPFDQLPEVMVKTLIGPPPDPNLANTAAWRAADMGAVNGHGNARALARILSVISLGGTVNGVQLLRPETVDTIYDVQTDGPDIVLLGHPVRRGLGFGLPQLETFPFVPEGRICFWGGWGGSWETMNPDHRATAAYVMNKMAPGIEGSDRTTRYFNLIYEALG
jgi:CubicO group peptidase (beta-lactamase class C family)